MIPFHFTFISVMSLLVEDTEPIVTMPTPYNVARLQDWNNHMEGVSTLVLVSAQAHPPLIKPKWAQALQTYPLKSLAEFSIQALFLASILASILDTTTLEDHSEMYIRIWKVLSFTQRQLKSILKLR